MAYIQDANFTPSKTNERLPEGNAVPGQEPTFVDQYLKLRTQRKMEKLIEDELGTGEHRMMSPPAAPAPAESLAATIVTKAMDLSSKANERVQAMADRNDETAQKARAEADKAKSDLFAITAQQIGGALEKINEMRQEIKAGSAPKDLVSQVKEARDLLTVLTPQVKEVQSAPQGLDPSVTISLEKMRMDHELALKNFDLQLAKMNQEFQLQLSKINAENSYKKQEYDDKKAFRTQGMSTLEDAVAGVIAGFGGGGAAEAPIEHGPVGRSAPVQPPAGSQPPAGRSFRTVDETLAEKPDDAYNEPVDDAIEQPNGQQGGQQDQGDQIAEVRVMGFPCQNCQTRVEVTPGAQNVICPKCGSDYQITYK